MLFRSRLSKSLQSWDLVRLSADSLSLCRQHLNPGRVQLLREQHPTVELRAHKYSKRHPLVTSAVVSAPVPEFWGSSRLLSIRVSPANPYQAELEVVDQHSSCRE